MPDRAHSHAGLCRLAGLLAIPALLASGCATPALNRARTDFYQGRWQQAEADLADATAGDTDRLLLLMERGLIRQARGEYKTSTDDFIAAANFIEQQASISLTKDPASLVVNDSVQEFSGAPYERTLLHAFTAKNFLAQGDWDQAAVGARRIIRSLTPEVNGDYPDNAYARYLAGFCLEMINDKSNAAQQYRKASALARNATIDEQTGRLQARNGAIEKPIDGGPEAPGFESTGALPSELTCFVLAGRTHAAFEQSPSHRSWQSWSNTPPVYAEIHHQGRYLGRSYLLTDSLDLAFTTEQIEAAGKAVKTITRVVIKEGIAAGVGGDNEALAELIRFILIGLLEQPDSRRWETLPRWLGVARVPCPPDLKDFDVVFKSRSGATIRSTHVTRPLSRRGNTFFSFCRDIVPVQEGIAAKP